MHSDVAEGSIVSLLRVPLAVRLLPALLVVLSSGPAAQSVPTQDAATGNYVVGPGDRLKVLVWNQENISGEYVVAGDGSFSFPLIGRVAVAGLTVGKLETELRRLLSDGFFRDPQVTASVVEYRSKRVFVMGALRQPGTYPLTREMTLIEALSSAGSATPDAADHAFIIRSNSAQGPVLPGEDASAHVIRVDLRSLDSGQRSPGATLHDGDTVYVPRAAAVFVYGEVRRPGSYPISQDTTVRQALALAGGLTEFGAAGRIRILRFVDGTEQEIRVKLNDPVRGGDTVVVPERFF